MSAQYQQLLGDEQAPANEQDQWPDHWQEQFEV